MCSRVRREVYAEREFGKARWVWAGRERVAARLRESPSGRRPNPFFPSCFPLLLSLPFPLHCFALVYSATETVSLHSLPLSLSTQAHPPPPLLPSQCPHSPRPSLLLLVAHLALDVPPSSNLPLTYLVSSSCSTTSLAQSHKPRVASFASPKSSPSAPSSFTHTRRHQDHHQVPQQGCSHQRCCLPSIGPLTHSGEPPLALTTPARAQLPHERHAHLLAPTRHNSSRKQQEKVLLPPCF